MLINVPLAQVQDNPFQRRRDYGDVERLAADILARGLLQIPRGRLLFDRGEVVTNYDLDLALRRIQTDGFPAGLRVQLAFGHRRLRAFKRLADCDHPEFDEMSIYVEALTDDQMLDAVWSENQHRSDINPVEQAELLAEKLGRARAAGGNQTTVAAEWNLDRSTIANKLRLLSLPAEVQTALRDRRLSERQAQALLPVMELESKLNGAAVSWATPNAPWVPASPADYVAKVLAAPEAATSDAIREYTKNAISHAGNPLGDDFATFDAGEGLNIIQATCKGCPNRQNQTCLTPACFDARSDRFFDALPQWAARETGLPYSSDAADFSRAYEAAQTVLSDWEAERRDDLVVGIDTDSWAARPFLDRRAADRHIVRADWRRAIILGRRGAGAAASPDNDAQDLDLPSADELTAWKKGQSKADKDRAARARQSLRSRLQPLMEDETPLRALMAMLDYPFRVAVENGTRPTPETMFDDLFTIAWKRVDFGSYDGTVGNRRALRRLLHAAAINPDIVDPADRVLRLIDIGQVALLTWNENRNRIGEAYNRRGRLREALAEFDAVANVVAGDEGLTRLAACLGAAARREEKLAATQERHETN